MSEARNGRIPASRFYATARLVHPRHEIERLESAFDRALRAHGFDRNALPEDVKTILWHGFVAGWDARDTRDLTRPRTALSDLEEDR